MQLAKGAESRGGRLRPHRSSSVTTVIVGLLLSSGGISAVIASQQLLHRGKQQQQQQQQQQQRPPNRQLPSSFIGSMESTHLQPVWTLDGSRFLRSPQQLSTSTRTDINTHKMSVIAGVSRQLDDDPPASTLPLVRQLLLDLPQQSQRERQKMFTAALIGFVKARDAEGALQVYDLAPEVGCRVSENIYNALLSTCSGEKVSQGMSVLRDMQAAGITLRENHYAFLFREAAGRGAFQEYFSLIRKMVDGGAQPRLRSYSPLLKGLCNEPDMALATEVWSHMMEQGVQPTPQEYVDMIKGWAEARELRQRVADGSVEAFLGELSEMAFELSLGREAAGASGGDMTATGSAEAGDSTTSSRRSEEADFIQTLLAAFNSDSNFSFSSGDTQTYSLPPSPIASLSFAPVSPPPPPEGAQGGVCDCCGAFLQVVGLDSPARARVRSALRRLASDAESPLTPPQSRARQRSRLDSAYTGEADQEGGWGAAGGEAGGDLEQFGAWLEERRREGVRFTTVVDGCNVAYYGQNRQGGKFQISQVDRLAQHLEQAGEGVLVVLPERYMRPCVPNSARSGRNRNAPSALSDRDLQTIEGWRERQMIYSCANRANDDLFWMYFTVSSDADTGGGGETAGAGTTSGIGDGSGPGLLTVISNDEMRDHRMALLEPVPFKRWRNSQVRGFHFPATSSPPEKHSGSDEPAVSDDLPPPPIVASPPAFTRDMQVAEHVWHIPVRGPVSVEETEGGDDKPENNAWLCINLAPFFGEGEGAEPAKEILPRRKYRH